MKYGTVLCYTVIGGLICTTVRTWTFESITINLFMNKVNFSANAEIILYMPTEAQCCHILRPLAIIEDAKHNNL